MFIKRRLKSSCFDAVLNRLVVIVSRCFYANQDPRFVSRRASSCLCSNCSHMKIGEQHSFMKLVRRRCILSFFFSRFRSFTLVFTFSLPIFTMKRRFISKRYRKKKNTHFDKTYYDKFYANKELTFWFLVSHQVLSTLRNGLGKT